MEEQLCTEVEDMASQSSEKVKNVCKGEIKGLWDVRKL